jgi:SAM-dependent methyltransferase
VQSSAERRLVEELRRVVLSDRTAPLALLNVGAGPSVQVESLLPDGPPYVIDRVDVEMCEVDHPLVRHQWQCSVENMAMVPSDEYAAIFANFVLEHVQGLQAAAREMRRVLRSGGEVVVTVPNPSAPEFQVSRRTPLVFHRVVRRTRAWDVVYAYDSIPALLRVFEEAGFKPREVRYFPAVGGYLASHRLLRRLGTAYDWCSVRLGSTRLLGHVCIVLVTKD